MDEEDGRVMANRNKNNAPRGQIWLCGACGKTSEFRTAVGDESCYENARLVLIDSIVRNEKGRVTAAKAPDDDGR